MKNDGEIYKDIFEKYMRGKYERSHEENNNFQETREVNSKELYLNKVDRISYKVLSIVGAALVGFSLIYLFFIFQPVVSEEISYFFNNNVRHSDLVVTTDVQKGDDKAAIGEADSLGLDPNFSVYVPKIDARGNIIPNVDTSNETEYLRVLKTHVAHAKGTYFPGQGKIIYLFSHSTDSSLNSIRYNAVFYLLSDLKPQDKIIIFFANKKYTYEVEESFITSASDVSFLYKDYSNETLILQTCYPPGTSLKRLIIIAYRLDI